MGVIHYSSTETTTARFATYVITDFLTISLVGRFRRLQAQQACGEEEPESGTRRFLQAQVMNRWPLMFFSSGWKSLVYNPDCFVLALALICCCFRDLSPLSSLVLVLAFAFTVTLQRLCRTLPHWIGTPSS